ncbi:MAG TPA: sigma-70 family RNA polymerase sigma factor [Longimicrobiaceae bacterium]|nr:sigma-70 family RNA polymerase sigma factor [Longimicrobiaceae bacterium]
MTRTVAAPAPVASGPPAGPRGGEDAAAADEAALVERVRLGDAAAFDALVTAYMRRAFSVAYRLMGQREDAEDLVQESFLAVLEKIHTFQAGRAFAPWFFRILVNRGLNARKSRTLRSVDEIPESAASALASPERDAERAELRDGLAAAMRALPDRQATVVRLFDMEGFSSPEIAEILGISEGTVRWHLHEARKTLRGALAPFGNRSTP